MDKLKQQLHQSEPFQDLDEKELELLILDGEVLEFHHHDQVLTQGRPGAGIYLLLEGKVTVTVNAIGKGTIHLATLSAGQFFGDVNLIAFSQCTATVTAKGKIVCFFLSKLIYDMFRTGFPLLHYKISQAILVSVLKRQRLLCTQIQTNSSTAIREKYNLAQHVRKPAKHYLKYDEATKSAALAYLTTLPILVIFTKNEIIKLIEHGNIIEAYSHYPLITAHTQQSACYFILTGSCTIQIPTDTDDINILTVSPNKWVSATNTIDHDANLYHVRVGELASLLEFNEKAIKSIIQNEPALWYKLHDLLCQSNVLLQKQVNTQIVRMSCEKNQPLKPITRGEI